MTTEASVTIFYYLLNEHQQPVTTVSIYELDNISLLESKNFVAVDKHPCPLIQETPFKNWTRVNLWFAWRWDHEKQQWVRSLIDGQQNIFLEDFREARVNMLQETDWTQLSDTGLSKQQKNLYAAYRKHLRDLPKKTDLLTPEFFCNIPFTFDEFVAQKQNINSQQNSSTTALTLTANESTSTS